MFVVFLNKSLDNLTTLFIYKQQHCQGVMTSVTLCNSSWGGGGSNRKEGGTKLRNAKEH
jgi:hypothetical protein